MADSWNAIITVDGPNDPMALDDLLEQLQPYSPAVSSAPKGRLELVVTFEAEESTLGSLVLTEAIAVLHRVLGARHVYDVQLMPTADYDSALRITEQG